MSDAGIGDIIRLDRVTKWFRTFWSKSFFVFVALVMGFCAGVSTVEWRIVGDCKYLNTFRIDHLSYTCNRRLNEQ